MTDRRLPASRPLIMGVDDAPFDPAGSELADALRAAGLSHRLALLERVPRALGAGEGLYLAHAGCSVRGPRAATARTLLDVFGTIA